MELTTTLLVTLKKALLWADSVEQQLAQQQEASLGRLEL
jgi:hypothetical protein